MEKLSYQPEQNIQAWFKAESLVALRDQLAQGTYPGYPNARLWIENEREIYEPFYLPDGAWETSEGSVPSIRERQSELLRNCARDGYGRPLHPWFYDMVTDPGIGVVTGKGAYWNWGPNYTADTIIFRHDRVELEVLLIQRSDTGKWALPGGFIDENELSLDAAVREAEEETGLVLAKLNPAVKTVYSGPLADLRVTANSWPETTAYRFDIFDTTGLDTVRGGDDALVAAWLPISKLQDELFGSHKLLIELALIS